MYSWGGRRLGPHMQVCAFMNSCRESFELPYIQKVIV